MEITIVTGESVVKNKMEAVKLNIKVIIKTAFRPNQSVKQE